MKKIRRGRVLSPTIGKFFGTGKNGCGRGSQAGARTSVKYRNTAAGFDRRSKLWVD